MAKRAYEEKLAELDRLATQSPEDALPKLRAALKNANNFMAGRAAEIARRLGLKELAPEMVTALDRFFIDAETSDPQCWAKNALSRALAEFDYPDSAVFLRGLRHIQMEPVWGGRSDTAGTLRSICAQALVGCRDLRENELLGLLLELFRDKDKAVRVEGARAIAQTGSDAAALLLRLRATLGDDEPEILAACFQGVLAMEGERAISWAAEFLKKQDETGAEAALALGQMRNVAALDALRAAFKEHSDPWFGEVLLTAIALTRQDAAFAFLLELIREESRYAANAISAIANSLPPVEVKERLEKTVRETGNERLLRIFQSAGR